ncbi:hypothetical protein [Methanolobus chelungpuianus]|nr:hypothetical protein [Methanolobus chelungpuianus]
MKNNRIRIASLLMAMLILSMVFVPAVSAKAEVSNVEKEVEKKVKDITDLSQDLEIEWVTNTESQKEYYATAQIDGEYKTYFASHWQEEIDGKAVWRFNIVEVNEEKSITASSISFGKGSYYWTDSSGLHLHFSSTDKQSIKEMSQATMVLVAAIIVAVCPPVGAYATVFIAALAIVIIAVDYIESNSDGSIDVYISYTQLALIPVYVLKSGTQYLSVKIGSHYYKVPL